MPRRAGSADLPLHGGKVPKWLAERMARLGAVVSAAIVYHYGRDELLRRLAHPFWFQSFGAVMGMDWHSSGITTSVVGALKRGLAPLEKELGVHVCGGRGKYSRQTPNELVVIGERVGFDGSALAKASRLVAKVDSAAVQDGFALYLHGFIVTDDGKWVVVQQGMNGEIQAGPPLPLAFGRTQEFRRRAAHRHRRPRARYDHQSHRSPRGSVAAHAARSPFIAGAGRRCPGVLGNLLITMRRPRRPRAQPRRSSASGYARTSRGAPERRAGATPARESGGRGGSGPVRFFRAFAHTRGRRSHGTRARHGRRGRSWRALRFADPARFSFAHGGKDGHPFPVPVRVYDQTIRVLKAAVRNAKLGREEQLSAIRRLDAQARQLECFASGPAVEELIAQERNRSDQYGGRTVFGPAQPGCVRCRLG